MNVKHPLSILALAVAAALPLAVLPAAAQTPTTISSIGVEQVRSLAAGKALQFTINATPDADVRLQIAGATAELLMAEIRPGVYEGTYTIRARDRLTSSSLVTAHVAKDGQKSSATLGRSLVIGAAAPLAPAQIASFDVTAPDRVRPGDELNFSLIGTPGSQARVTVRGVAKPIALTETSSGLYEGTYVMRRQERLGSALLANAYLVNNRRETSQRFERTLVVGANDGGNNGTRVAQVACANCGRVESVNKIEVKDGSSNAIGTVAGGVLGAVIGNQVGGGRGRDVARVVGAIGGAYAGNRVQNNMDKNEVYRVTVRLTGGTTQNFDYPDDPAVAIGTRVKIEDGLLIRL